MDFPPYVFREYPKQLTLQDGTFVIVQSQEEEDGYQDQVQQ